MIIIWGVRLKHNLGDEICSKFKSTYFKIIRKGMCQSY